MRSTTVAKFAGAVVIMGLLMTISLCARGGTITVQHGALNMSLGAPVSFSYTPDWYVVNDPTHTIGLGLRPYATLGNTLAHVQCQGAANLLVSQNPGWGTLSLNASSGTATMNLGLTAGLDIKLIAFGYTVQGSLNNTPNWGFNDSKTFTSYLLNDPVTLSGQIAQTLVSLNTLDALTVEFGIIIPSWLAGINLNINAVANLNQSIKGASIATSAGSVWSEGQSLNVYLNGGSYQVQSVQETWTDSASLSLGLGADLSADLLWGVLTVTLVDFGSVPLITAQQDYQLHSDSIAAIQFDLSTGGGSAPVVNALSPSSLTGLPAGQTQLIRIIGSGFTIGSTLTFNDGVNAPYTGRVPVYVSGNELDYNISVGTNAANWTVQVVNGAQQSNLGYFSVAAPPPPSSGSLTVTLQPSGAVSAGAQWQVDGTGYNNSGQTVGYLAPGSHTVTFKSISSYTTPASFTVSIVGSQQTATNATYSAVAATTYTLALNNGGSMGYVTPSPSGNWNGSAYVYASGSAVQLTATAYPGYHFVGWGGDVSGTGNPTSITMNGNKTVSATFAEGDPSMGTVIVTIQPPEAAAAGVKWGWNQNDYINSGVGYTTYPGGYWVVLHGVDGWLGPPLQSVTVTAGQTANYTVTFTQDTTPGLLTVTLSPPDAVTAGARWHVNSGAAQGNGATVSLPPGTNYTISFDSVPGWTAPANQTVTVQRAQTKVVAGNYTPPPGQPVIGSIFPPIGPMTGGTLLTINGVNFTAPATVLVGGKPATNVTVSSATQISAFTPSNPIYGTAPVVVQTSTGSATNLNGFAYGMARGNKLNLTSSIGGSAFAVAVQGNYAYMAEGRYLLVLDISTPSAPSRVGSVLLPGVVADIALFGQYAYIADGEAGLQVVDVSSPTAPAIRGFYAATNYTWTAGIEILGGRAYVADENVSSGLEIFDLGAPTVPTLLSSISCGGSAEDVLVKASTNGVFAYVTTGSRLSVVDVSQPLTPILRGQTSMGSRIFSIAMSGNYVFGAEIGSGALHMVDVSNPNAPIDIEPATGDSGTGGYAEVAAAGNYLYAESTENGIGFTVFSVSGTNLTRIGRSPSVYSTGDYYTKMALSSNKAYVAGGASGLQIVDVSNQNSPSLLAAFTDSGFCGNYGSVAVSGDYVCATAGDFKVFDASQPSQPILVGQLNGIGGSRIVAKNGVAYLNTANGNVIDVVSISTPSSPQILTNISYNVVYPSGLALVGNMLYVVGQNTSSQPRFVAIDVSNPSSPIVRGTHDFTSFGNGFGAAVGVSGNKAIVGLTASTYSVRVLDISSIATPVERGGLTNIHAQDIRMSSDGNYAFVTDYNSNSVQILNLTNLNSPFAVTNITLDSTSLTGLDILGNELCAATIRGVFVFDVSIPAAPALIRSYSTLSYINGVRMPGDSVNQIGNIYLADREGGIAVLKEQDIQAPNVYITNPTFSSFYTNATSTFNLGGGSDDNVGVTAITWSNNRGGSGRAGAPFDSWFVSGIVLYPGTNVLTVTAFDAAGNSGRDTLTVIYPSTNLSQTITFPAIADHTFGDAPIQVVAASSSGLPVVFSVVSGPAALSSSNILTLTGAGAVTVEAGQPGNSSFNSATPVDVNFNVARASQSITFTPVSSKSAGDPPFALTATTSSGLPVFFTLLSGPAIMSSNVVSLLGAGTVNVLAWQPGNSNYNAAATVQDSFTVSKVPQTISFGPLSQQKAGDAPFAIFATADSGLPVSFSVAGPATLSGNIVALTGWGTVTITASQPGNNTYAPAANVTQSFFVVPPPNVIANPARLPDGSFQFSFYGIVGSNYTLQASASLTNWVSLFTFTCTNAPTPVVDRAATNYSRRFYRTVEQ